MENLTNNENQSDSKSAGGFSNSIDLQAQSSSADPQASELETDNQLHQDQSPKSAGHSEIQMSANNETDGIGSDSSGTKDSVLENQGIPQNQGSNESRELPEDQDAVFKPETHEVAEQSGERTIDFERSNQNQETSSIPGILEAQVSSDSPALPKDEDTVEKSESHEVTEGFVESASQNQDTTEMSATLEAQLLDDGLQPEDSAGKTPAKNGSNVD